VLPDISSEVTLLVLFALEDKILRFIQNVGRSSANTPEDIISQGSFTSVD
jgi:hypothetical protein